VTTTLQSADVRQHDITTERCYMNHMW